MTLDNALIVRQVQVENYHRAFPDMHRELHHVYVSGNIVVVQQLLRVPGLRGRRAAQCVAAGRHAQ